MSRIIQDLRTIMSFIAFTAMLIVAIPVGYIVSLFPSNDPMGRWNRLFQGLFRVYFRLTGVTFVVEGLEHIPVDQPTLFAANHQGFLDGPILDVVLAPRRLVALTAPFHYFPWPISFWFSKIGGIEVARSPEEQKKYPSVGTHHQVVERMVRELTHEKRSAFLFPEGHVERGQHLLPFKSGAVRIALQAGVPLVPVTIRGSRRIFPPGHPVFREGVVTVTFHKTNPLPKAPELMKNERLVAYWTDQLIHRIVHGLPTNYEKDLNNLPACDCRHTFTEPDRVPKDFKVPKE